MQNFQGDYVNTNDWIYIFKFHVISHSNVAAEFIGKLFNESTLHNLALYLLLWGDFALAKYWVLIKTASWCARYDMARRLFKRAFYVWSWKVHSRVSGRYNWDYCTWWRCCSIPQETKKHRFNVSRNLVQRIVFNTQMGSFLALFGNL